MSIFYEKIWSDVVIKKKITAENKKKHAKYNQILMTKHV